MHSDFADWYQIAAIDPKDINLKARWAGVEAFAKDATALDMLDAGRVFYGLPPKAAKFVERFRAPFKNADEKFLMLGNTAELRVLVGSMLAAILEQDDGKRGTTAALTLSCGSFRDRRTSPVGDIVRLARESLVKRSARLRERPTVTLPDAKKASSDAAKKVEELQKTLQANGGLSTLTEPLAKIVKDLNLHLSTLLTWAQAQEGQQTLRREESDVLWWLFGGHSRDLNVAFKALPPPMIILLAAKEMADLTGTIPGPYSARAFLGKAVLDGLADASQKTSLAAAVTACLADWRQDLTKRPEIPNVEDLCPVLLALRKVDEAASGEAGLKVFETITGLKADEAQDPVDLAEQAYEEWLLARVSTGPKS